MIEAKSNAIIKEAIKRYSQHFKLAQHETHLKVWLYFDETEPQGEGEAQVDLNEVPLIYSLVKNYTETLWDNIPFFGGDEPSLSILGKKLDFLGYGYFAGVGIRSMLNRLAQKHGLSLRNSYGLLLMPKNTDTIIVAVVRETEQAFDVIATYPLSEVLQQQLA